MKSFIRAGIALVLRHLPPAFSLQDSLIFRFHQTQLEASVKHELRLVVNIRLGQLSDMLQSFRSQALLRVGGANNNDMLISFLQSDETPDEELQDWLAMQVRHNGYHNVLVVDSAGVVRADARGGEFSEIHERIPPACLEVLHEAIQTRRPST